MASRYSMTIQLADPSVSDASVGHAAVAINTPDGQTYAGFGPKNYDWKSLFGLWSSPRFAPETVSPGQLPSDFYSHDNFNTVFGHSSHTTHTIPISDEQAQKALAEIERIRSEGNNYNMFNKNVCTTVVNRIAKAAGLGSDILYEIPARSGQYLADVEKALVANPRSRFIIDGAGRPVAIPESLRGMQQDYAFVGGGHDTPSERSGRVPSAQASGADLPPGQRAAMETNDPSHADQMDTSAAGPERYLRGRLVDRSGRTVFETGVPPVPFVPSGALAPQASASNRPPQLSSAGPAPAGAQYSGNNAPPPGGSSSRQALPLYPVSPIPAGRDAAASSDAAMSDWFTRRVKPLLQN